MLRKLGLSSTPPTKGKATAATTTTVRANAAAGKGLKKKSALVLDESIDEGPRPWSEGEMARLAESVQVATHRKLRGV